MEFGTRLRELRAESGATLADVAEATGISVPMLSRMENGQRLPSPRFAEALANYFEVPVDDLLADVASDSMRARYGIEPDSYRSRSDEDARWAPAEQRISRIRQELQARADITEDAVPKAESDVRRSVRGDMCEGLPPEDAQASAAPHYVAQPIGSLFSESRRSPSESAALAQRASLRHLREMLRAGDTSLALEAVRAAGDLAEDPIALLREAAAHPDPRVREDALRLLERLSR